MQEVWGRENSSSQLYIYRYIYIFYKICYDRLDHFGGQKKSGSEI